MTDFTDKQKDIYTALRELNAEGIEPTVRSLADRLETRKNRSARYSDDEVRGLLVRLQAKQAVEPQGDDPVRYVALDVSDD